VITATATRTRLDTEAAAATDDLDTINGGSDGDLIILSTTNSARDVVVKDGTGNLVLAGDFTLSTTSDRIKLIYDSTLSAWVELSRSDNA
jgi:pectate lyase